MEDSPTPIGPIRSDVLERLLASSLPFLLTYCLALELLFEVNRDSKPLLSKFMSVDKMV